MIFSIGFLRGEVSPSLLKTAIKMSFLAWKMSHIYGKNQDEANGGGLRPVSHSVFELLRFF